MTSSLHRLASSEAMLFFLSGKLKFQTSTASKLKNQGRLRSIVARLFEIKSKIYVQTLKSFKSDRKEIYIYEIIYRVFFYRATNNAYSNPLTLDKNSSLIDKKTPS